MRTNRAGGHEMIRDLKPYPAYKDSGVPWLGKVPEHWLIERLKSVMSNIIQMTRELQNGESYVALEHVESWTGRLRQAAPEVFFDSQVKRFQSGDVLFGKLRPYLAKVTRLASDGVCVGEFFVLRPCVSNVTAPYIEQLLRSKPVIDVINSSTFGAKMPRVDWQFMGGMMIPLPPIPEQTAIVRFLGHIDRRIRRSIHAKQKLIKLLEEQKQAIVHQAVTRGLDPNVRLKPSGVEWLGEVPEHWEIVALRLRYNQCLGKMLDSKRIKGEHSVRYLRNQDVQWDWINTSDLPVMDIAPEEYERYTLKSGDLLVCEGGEVGRCAIWQGDSKVCGFQKALHRLRPHSMILDEPRFMYYLLIVASRSGAFADGHESTIAHLTGDKLRKHRFPFPPKFEQSAIVHYLDGVAANTDHATTSTKREISLLREYRNRLIADAVTGKVDVRHIPLPDESNIETIFGEDIESLDNETCAFDEVECAVEIEE
ncbi:Type I restriction modification DNA specificity domain protein [anaerobic digester metagenome]